MYCVLLDICFLARSTRTYPFHSSHYAQPSYLALVPEQPLDGLSYVEIARRLDVSERTVSRYMTQALRQCWLSELQP